MYLNLQGACIRFNGDFEGELIHYYKYKIIFINISIFMFIYIYICNDCSFVRSFVRQTCLTPSWLQRGTGGDPRTEVGEGGRG